MLSAFEEKSRMLIYGNRDDFKPKECSLFLESKFANVDACNHIPVTNFVHGNSKEMKSSSFVCRRTCRSGCVESGKLMASH